MTLFKSLLFRELKLRKRGNIYYAVLIIIFTAFIWSANLLIIPKLSTEQIVNPEIKPLFVDMFSIFISCICIITAFSIDEVFKSDLNSGWMKYSYSLPITPFERAVVRMARIYLITAIGIMFSILNWLCLCAFADVQLTINFFVVLVMMTDAALVLTIINDFFILSARSISEYNKMFQRAGIVTLLVLVGFIALVLNKTGFSLERFKDDSYVQRYYLSKLSAIMSAKMLLWALPLMILLIAVHFAVTYYRFCYAYHLTVQNQKADTEDISKEEIITDTHDYPTGFLYKEIRQNKPNIIGIAAVPIFLAVLWIVMVAAASIQNDNVDKGWIIKTFTSDYGRIGLAVAGYYFASGLISNIFQGDDKKLCAYFTVSTPIGIKGYMYYKYVLNFAMSGLYIVISCITDLLVSTIRYFATGEEAVSLIGTYIIVFFMLLFRSALDIPFIVRYGNKKGHILKLITSIIVAGLIIIGFVSIPESMQDSILNTIYSLITGIKNSNVMLVSGVLMFVVLGIYILSYRISCSLFINGVDDYDK